MKKLIIIGAGGHARETLWLARSCSGFEVLGFADDSKPKSSLICDVPVLGKISTTVTDSFNNEDVQFVVAIGDPRIRKNIVDVIKAINSSVRFATLIHPSVLCSKYVEIGAGSMISAGVILTTQVVVGEHVIINVGAACGHDVVIGDYSTIGPKAQVSGGVVAHAVCEIAAGVVVRQGVRFGQGSMAAMGSVVMRDVAEYSFVIGNPARPMKELDRI